MSATPEGWSALHASAVIVGESGLLLRGPSGTGKSALALALLATARNHGTFAALVSDDRVYLAARSGRLVARGVADFAGKIERRGFGVIDVVNEPAAVIRLIVDLVARAGPPPPRMPAKAEETIEILGLSLPRIGLDPALGPLDQAVVVLEALAGRGRDQL